MDSPAAKPYEAVAHMGACSSSAGNGQEGNNVSSLLIKPSVQWNILMADSIPSKKVCRNCKQAKPADQFISKKKSSISCGRLTVDCLDCRNRQASRASKRTAEQAELSPKRRGGLPLIDLQLRTPILPKESEVADTEWRNHAEAITRSLPRRPLRGGLRSNRARKSHDTANSGGSALHQPPSQLQRPLSPRERGAPEAAGFDPPLFHQRFLPQERRDGDDERRGRAAIIQPKQSVSEDIRRSELAAAIARGLPQRRRGRGRPPKARPDTSGASNIGGSEQHPALTHRDEPPRKQIRAGTRRQRRRELQAEDLASVLRFLEDEFAVKESLSNEQTCCTPIPHEKKVSTVRTFYKAFHDVDTLPIWTCMLCYRKRTKKELRDVTWDQWMSSCVEKKNRSLFLCWGCFPVGETFSACAECACCLRRGVLLPVA
ncbi:hypothetical protein AUP68_04105 [Ilyonectria robusta]